MGSGDHQDRERDVGERIACLMQSIGRTPKKPITSEELRRLKSAAGRLDQMLKAGADADQQALRSAAERLDRLLCDIRTGKDVSNDFKRRRGRNAEDS